MTQQERFEADYLAVFAYREPDLTKEGCRYIYDDFNEAFEVWLQQATRHEAEIAELVSSLKEMEACYCTVGPNMSSVSRQTHRVALMKARAAIAKHEVKS